jgi:hypothetical protein
VLFVVVACVVAADVKSEDVWVSEPVSLSTVPLPLFDEQAAKLNISAVAATAAIIFFIFTKTFQIF